MGIKFNCPNGHKLHVKSFLAGKKGVCPECGARFRIPKPTAQDDHDDGHAVDIGAAASGIITNPSGPFATSTTVPGSGPGLGQPSVGPASPAPSVSAAPWPVGPQALPTGSMPAVGGSIPVAASAGSVAPFPGPQAPTGIQFPDVAHGVATGGPTVGVPAIVAQPQADPISENPAAVWYVRPPSGGQYGPARGDVMRKWITEGRVTADSLVWREGWTDWKNAAASLPGFSSPTAASVPAIPEFTTAIARPTTPYIARRKKSNALGVAVLVVLALVCIALVAVLVVVLGGVQLDGSTVPTGE
jgi:hypothetical protein